MKTTIAFSTIAVLAVTLVTGCNKNSSNDSYGTNSVTDGTSGMMSTNMPSTNNVPDMNRNATTGTTNQ